MRAVHIDLETFSSVDIKRGVYCYAESEDFKILLLGYRVDDEPVQVLDLSEDGIIPEDFVQLLMDADTIKWAHNAQFERVCLSMQLRRQKILGVGAWLDPEQWRCTMVLASYCGLPASLRDVGAALKLDRQKLDTGEKLIRVFCVPSQKRDLMHDGYGRALPEYYREQWAQFIEYNRRDVETESEIHARLSHYDKCEELWSDYATDQRINDRGIGCDAVLAGNAVEAGEREKSRLMGELRKLTGSENPNSAAQMKTWLRERGLEVESIGKKQVGALLDGELPGDVREALETRANMAKSSVAKYTAMLNTMNRDGRIRGCFQYYGAGRSGRWAGRNVQLQNLPQNHMEDLDEARTLLRSGDFESFEAIYSPTLPALSELIRTALIPREGCIFYVADFSAIEARVIAWLADETWRMELFERGGDIYCQSASQMFGVPVVKHGVNGHLRQKGKIAELACIAEGQLVLTDHGEKPIEDVQLTDRLWDGCEWVTHEGVVFNGFREVISYGGLEATGDHTVWAEIDGQNQPVRFDYAAACGARLLQSGAGRQAVWVGENNIIRTPLRARLAQTPRTGRVHGLRTAELVSAGQSHAGALEGLPIVLLEAFGSEMAGEAIHGRETALRKPQGRKLQKLRGTGYPVRVRERDGGSTVDDRNLRRAEQGTGAGQDRRKWQLRAGQSALGNTPAKLPEPTAVYDIKNAGPRHRYTVSGVLVHNCGYGGSVGALKAMGGEKLGLTKAEMSDIVEKWRGANPNIKNLWEQVGRAVDHALRQPGRTFRVADGRIAIKTESDSEVMRIRLPSGRCLSYWQPGFTTNRFGEESAGYMGMDQKTHKWKMIESYGPKFVENIVQGISRDLLCNAMQRVQPFDIVAHVHDELIIEAPDEPGRLEWLSERMADKPAWAEGLLLRADGYVTPYYKKD